MAMMKSFIFQSLHPDNVQEVIDAFNGPHIVNPGTEVIVQGAAVQSGEPALFVIEAGRLDVHKRTGNAPHPGVRVFQYDQMGQSFGELALLYNCPRAATVTAASSAVLWSLDRDTFNHCVKEATLRTRARHEKFLKSVELLSTLTVEERMRVVDVLKVRVYQAGEVIIRRGEEGSEFFILEQGRAVASID